jgi:demethylmenaquinone methyltransferase/2-methoxy-6-polyprenyl-1,4-benzoquinol methylase
VARDRGQRVYDWWAGHQRLFHLFATVAFAGREAELRSRSIGGLRLNAGERVLDLACGPGVNFDRLAYPVGPDGAVVGVDYSRRMVRRARKRAERRAADCATAVLGNAERLPFPDASFDAAYSSLSVSAMPNGERAVAETYRVLRPGGRFVVLDAQPYQEGPGRLLNPVVDRLSAWLTNWQPDLDVPALVDDAFDESRTETFNAGTFFVTVGRKSS